MSAIRSGAERIADERARQVTQEGYDVDHDDHHKSGELAMAAACYAAAGAGRLLYVRTERANAIGFSDPWPWQPFHDNRPHIGNVIHVPGSVEGRISILVKAGALIAAEIDRLERSR